MMESQTLGVAAVGRAAFSCADAAMARAQLQRDLAAESRPSNLKNTDDQSVAGLLAARQLHIDDPQSWGVVAAPQSPGRSAMTTTLERFATDGAWTVSPHVIPHCSLHSLAGLVSLTFGIRGPNLGVGGLAGREGEAWLVASAWLASGIVPGVMLVLAGGTRAGCHAIAIALHNEAAQQSLTIAPSRPGAEGAAPTFSLAAFDHVHTIGANLPLRASWVLPGGATLVWHNRLAAARAAA